MLTLLPTNNLYASLQGQYGFLYPNLEDPIFVRDPVTIEAVELQYLSSTTPQLQAYRINKELAENWNTSTVIWVGK